MQDVFIVEALRTPIGKYAGILKDVRPDDLAATVVKAVVARAGVPCARVDDVFFGDANQAGEDNRNVARMAALLAGLPVEVPGVTVNRLCGSGLQAVVSAAREIQVGACDLAIAGGVESMTRAPLVMPKPDSEYARGNRTVYDTTLGWRMVNSRMAETYPPVSLGETAENVAEKYGISREDQDRFALGSHEKSIAAQDSCRFSCEIVPVEAPVSKGSPVEATKDEGPRRDTSLEKLAKLRAAFVEGGSVTAGNSSQINDGAAALLLASGAAALSLGLKPLARFVDAATAGVDPSFMGMGPVPATEKLLGRLRLPISDIDVVEINEAFASQVLACIRELGIEEARVNPNGGAIALGHPLGASGARLVTTLAHELQRTTARYGLTTMCIGVGQGISAVFERVDG
jgi:3-oxoadipyl-CoA thiolase